LWNDKCLLIEGIDIGHGLCSHTNSVVLERWPQPVETTLSEIGWGDDCDGGYGKCTTNQFRHLQHGGYRAMTGGEGPITDDMIGKCEQVCKSNINCEAYSISQHDCYIYYRACSENELILTFLNNQVKRLTKKCRCSNGDGAVGEECPHMGDFHCVSCDDQQFYVNQNFECVVKFEG